jgi:hypothetical protein
MDVPAQGALHAGDRHMKEKAHGMEPMVAREYANAELRLALEKVRVCGEEVHGGAIHALKRDGAHAIIAWRKRVHRGYTQQHDFVRIARADEPSPLFVLAPIIHSRHLSLSLSLSLCVCV